MFDRIVAEKKIRQTGLLKLAISLNIDKSSDLEPLE